LEEVAAVALVTLVERADLVVVRQVNLTLAAVEAATVVVVPTLVDLEVVLVLMVNHLRVLEELLELVSMELAI
jgi:hypothetical protein